VSRHAPRGAITGLGIPIADFIALSAFVQSYWKHRGGRTELTVDDLEEQVAVLVSDLNRMVSITK
jgi:hypothetical protein